MISFTAGISEGLELRVEQTQNGIEHGHAYFVDLESGKRIYVHPDEIAPAARAFALVAQLLDDAAERIAAKDLEQVREGLREQRRKLGAELAQDQEDTLDALVAQHKAEDQNRDREAAAQEGRKLVDQHEQDTQAAVLVHNNFAEFGK